MSNVLYSMFDRIISSTLFRSASVYTIANTVNQALPFFLLPILTHYLMPEEYGLLSMFQVLVGFLNPFVGLSVFGAIRRQFYEQNTIDYQSYITSCLILILIATLITSVIIAVTSEIIYHFTLFPPEWLTAVMVFVVGQVLIHVLLVLWQGEERPVSYGTFQIGRSILNVGLSLVLVVFCGIGWKGRIVGQTGANATFASLALWLLWRGGRLNLRINLTYIKHALKFGVPLIPHAMGVFLISMTDRLFITNMVGIADTGIYTVGYQVGMIIGLLAASFNTAYVPWLFRNLKIESQANRLLIVRLTYGYFFLLLLGAAGLSWLGPLLIRLFMGVDYGGATSYVLWCAFGYAFNGMYMMVTAYIFYAEKTHLLAWVTFIAVGLNVVLNYLLIKLNGPLGAAQATVITFGVKFLLTWYLSDRVRPMPWRLAPACRI